MIKKYSDALNEMGRIYGGEAKTELALKDENEANEEFSDKESNESPKEENAPEEADKATYDKNSAPSEGKAAIEDNEPLFRVPSVTMAEGEATAFAFFSANVFAGEEAYPIEGARIVVYRGDNIYAFLSTDENGKTKRIKLPAFEKENSLQADNPDKAIDYQADIFAEGFNAQKGLLVSAVGGSDIILKALLVPEGERIG